MSTKKTNSFDQLKLLAQRTKTELDALQSAMPSKVSDLTNDSGFQTAAQVEASINAKISSAYKGAGSKAPADLTSTLLVEANEGKVYNITAAFTTTADFVEGAGKKHPAGTNVVVINTAESGDAVYKFDVLAGFVDLSGYTEKVDGATAGNFAALDAEGNTTDSGKSASDFVAAESGKRLMTDAEGTKLDGISEGATKTEASETEGAIKIDGTEVAVVTFATDAEVTAMLNEVFGSSGD